MSDITDILESNFRVDDGFDRDIFGEERYAHAEAEILASFWTDGGIKNGDGRYVVETKNSQCVVQMSAGGSMDRVGGMNIIRHFKIPT